MKMRYKCIICFVSVFVLYGTISISAFADPLTFAGAATAALGAAGIESTIGAGAAADSYNSYWNQNGFDTDDFVWSPYDNSIYYIANSSSGYDTIYFDEDLSQKFNINAQNYAWAQDIIAGNLKTINVSQVGNYNFTDSAGAERYYVVGDWDSGSYSVPDASISLSINGNITSYSGVNPLRSFSGSVNWNWNGPLILSYNINSHLVRFARYDSNGRYIGSWLTDSAWTISGSIVNYQYVLSPSEYIEWLDTGKVIALDIPTTYRPLDISSDFNGEIDAPAFDSVINALALAGASNVIENARQEDYPLIPPSPTPTPEPTPVPVPTTPIIDATVADVVEPIVDNVNNGIQNVIDAIESTAEGTDDEIESAAGYLGGLIGLLHELLRQGLITLEEAIALVREAVSSLEEVLEEVLEAVQLHPLDLFGAALDDFQISFGGAMAGIRERLGIWHYVVEWLNCIGTCFRWFLSIFQNTAYCMVVPIYASVAGLICLSLYRRFGR